MFSLISPLLTRASRSALIDGRGRRIDHLRLSVTSACNLRCAYCRPGGRHDRLPNRAWNDDQRVELVAFLHRAYGLAQVRLTGGEPLLHPGLIQLVRRIHAVAPDLSLAMTTNALLLADRAEELFHAGLKRLNISLDTLDPRRYQALTGGMLNVALQGIDAAIEAGLPPPRINTVVLRGWNDDELPTLAHWAWDRGCEIRFLEAMPIGPAADFNREHFVSAREIRSRLDSHFELTELPRRSGETAVRYEARGQRSRGTIGIIAPVTETFCGQCRRIRVTADGRLFPCLLDARHLDLSEAWPDGVFDEDRAHDILQTAVADKAESGAREQLTGMVQLGG